MSTRAPYILDCDTGIDDAAALALAARSPEVELLAVTTVAGNVPVSQTTENSLRVLSYLGSAEAPVHRGASRPIVREPRHATHVHGSNGLGGVELAASGRSIGPDRGPAAIVRLAMGRPGEITLVCVGPLTNLAIALNVEPELVRLLKRVVIMGGAFFNRGNITPHAEFNIFVDPEAAVQVFSAPFNDLTVVGLDVSHQTALPPAVWESAAGSADPAGRLLHQVYAESFSGRQARVDCYLHDPLAFAIAIDPTLAGYETGEVAIETSDDRRGMTAVRSTGRGARIARTVDVERFLAMFSTRLSVPK